MITCGIDLSGSNAIFVVLKKEKGKIENITGDFKKIPITDHKNPKEIRSFFETISNHFDTVMPDRIGIIARQVKGSRSAGGISFKMEALIQLYPKRNALLVWPITLNKYERENTINMGNINKYQHDAYKLAHYLLHKK